MLINENHRTKRLYGSNATVLDDSGYQGLSVWALGAITSYKRSRGRQFTEEQAEFKISEKQ